MLLLALGHGLRRRKRRAWRTVVTLLALSSISSLLRLEILPTLVSASLLVTLVVRRDDFRALGDPTTRWRAVRVFGQLVVADLVVGLALVYSARRAL